MTMIFLNNSNTFVMFNVLEGQCKMLVCRFSPFRRSQTKLTSLDNDFNLCPYIIIENVQNNAENVITVKTQVRAV